MALAPAGMLTTPVPAHDLREVPPRAPTRRGIRSRSALSSALNVLLRRGGRETPFSPSATMSVAFESASSAAVSDATCGTARISLKSTGAFWQISAACFAALPFFCVPGVSFALYLNPRSAGHGATMATACEIASPGPGAPAKTATRDIRSGKAPRTPGGSPRRTRVSKNPPPRGRVVGLLWRVRASCWVVREKAVEELAGTARDRRAAFVWRAKMPSSRSAADPRAPYRGGGILPALALLPPRCAS